MGAEQRSPEAIAERRGAIPGPGMAAGGPSASDSPLGRLALLDPEHAMGMLGTRHEGLTPAEAEARLASEGPNLLPKHRGPGLPRQLLDQMFHFFALMLWVAAGLAFLGQMPQLGWAIMIVVVLNGLFSYAQEYRAERAIRALSALLPESAVVRRGGPEAQIPAANLVPGDIVLLREGDRISADARVIRSVGLKVDISMLTGESKPVLRVAGPLTELPVDITEASNVVFAGTFVTSGSATAVVAATGSRTQLGAISKLTEEILRRPTPLRLQMNRVVRVIATCAVATGIVFFSISLGLGMPAHQGFLFGIGVIVAVVPCGMLPTLALSLAVSATRMARQGALVRRLESVETLGSTTVICSDKTGTITANEMTARAIAVRGHHLRATGSGYDPDGAILENDRPLAPGDLRETQPLLRAAALCTNVRVEQRDGRWRCIGDPTEGALVVLARKGGVERNEVERDSPRVREFAFESARRRMSTVHRLPSGALEVLTKGSPEAIIEICSSCREEGRTVRMTPDVEARFSADVDALADEGYRLLAFARREISAETDRAVEIPASVEEAEHDLELLGLVGMADPVRPEVPGAVARCQQAGIRVIMITGDHPVTARSVAETIGLPVKDVILGTDLPDDAAALERLLENPEVSVLARTAPEKKLAIARALQAMGEVVAMTGDGVNDAPALKQSDIGVAMGVVGTDVAREAADLVLLDDNFAHIIEAVEEGRAAFDNIKRFLTYHLTDNVAELAPFVVWALSVGHIPLMISVLQVLALDVGTDILPAVALGAERAEPGTMHRPPRPRSARLIDLRVLGRSFGFLGLIEAVVSMMMLPLGAALYYGWRPGQSLPAAGSTALAALSAMVFSAIVLMQMANAFECRNNPASLFSIRFLSNHLLVGAIMVEALMLVAFVYVPGISHALGQHPLRPAQWLPMILIAPWTLLALEEIRKAVVRRRAAHDRSSPFRA